MRRTFSTLFVALTATFCTAAEPWRLSLVDKEAEIQLKLDLYGETIDVPGMEMFGPMNGYMNGRGIFGVWTVTSFDIKDDREATLRLSNDQGSETQRVRLTWLTDSTCQADLQGGVVMKKSVNRKLVKLPSKLLFRRN